MFARFRAKFIQCDRIVDNVVMMDVISGSAVSFYQTEYVIRCMMKFGRARVTEKPFAGYSRRAFRPSVQRLR